LIIDSTKTFIEQEVEDKIWLSDPIEVAKALVLAKKIFPPSYSDAIIKYLLSKSKDILRQNRTSLNGH